MIERAVVEERWGKTNPSFWGQSSWEGREKYNKLDAFIRLIIFLAGLSISIIISFACRVKQPIAMRFRGGGSYLTP